MLHLVDIAFLFTSVESLRPERRKRANIESQSRRGGGGDTKIHSNKPSNIPKNKPKLL